MSVEAITVVLHHSHAKGTAKLVLIGIANHDGDGGSWPAIATLAKYANVDARSVQRAISSLVDLGELAVHAQDGGVRKTPDHLRPNRYTILISCPPGCDRGAQHRVTLVSPHPVAQVSPGDAGVTPPGDAGVTPPVTLVSPEPSFNQPIEPSNTQSATPAGRFVTPIGPQAFDAFWTVYPRKVGKATAAKAFTSACNRAAATDIIDAARRMAADPNLPAARFIPHPTTWLNRDGWGDDPYPDGGTVNHSATPRQQSESERFDRAMARAVEREKAMGLR